MPYLAFAAPARAAPERQPRIARFGDPRGARTVVPFVLSQSLGAGSLQHAKVPAWVSQ